MNKALERVLAAAYRPCCKRETTCRRMWWCPEAGQIPRGMCGATGSLSDVRLVLVTAEPGDPLPGERYSDASPAAAARATLECLSSSRMPFHRNLRPIIDECFPGMTLPEQLARVWITNSVLCSAPREGGPVPKPIETTCGETYLRRQLELLPNAMVVSLGRKSERRLLALGIPSCFAFHPSSRKSEREKLDSWSCVARHVRGRVQAST
jgi:hypothetical protein